MEVEQDLRLGNKKKTLWKNPGRIDELRQGCKRRYKIRQDFCKIEVTVLCESRVLHGIIS